jgi:protease-4
VARRHPILRGLLGLAGITLGLLVVSVVVASLVRGDGERLVQRLPFGHSVAVVEIRGVIEDARELIEQLDDFRTDDHTVAVVLRINSPGGAVPPAQETWDAIRRLREKKPVVASLGNVAASAAYYIASACGTVVASPGTLTGSIGVIMQLPYFGPLAEKVGVSEETVKSGPFKDVGSGFRPLEPKERALLQGMIDDVLGQFVSAVAEGRGMALERVQALADGRVFTGAQAHDVGLVDQLGGLTDATRIAWEAAGETGEPHVVTVRPRRRFRWLKLLNETFLGGTGADRLRLVRLLEQALTAVSVHETGGFFSIYGGPSPR